MDDFSNAKYLLEKTPKKNIRFKKHFYERTRTRPINEELVLKTLNNTNALLHAERQETENESEKKYKLWLKLSNRYSLVVVGVFTKKYLYIITAWNTDRKWQRKILK